MRDHRLAPHDLDAERAVLGACLVSSSALSAVLSILEATDFYSERHRAMYRAIYDAAQDHKEVDHVVARPYADEETANALLDLYASVPTAANASLYARDVKRAAVARQTLDAADRIREQCLSGDHKDALAFALAQFEGLARDEGDAGAQTYAAALDEFDKLLARRRKEKGITGIHTGIGAMDRALGGLNRGTSYIFAARPGIGKSLLVGQIAQAAANQGYRVLLQTPEMSELQYLDRIAHAVAEVDYDRAYTGDITDAEEAAIKGAARVLAKLPLYVDDRGTQTVARIRSNVMRFKPDLLLVDYLGYVTPDDPSSMRTHQIGQISRGLTRIKSDFDIPVILAAQLNRDLERRVIKRPNLADLRDCLPGDALVHDAESGRRVKISDVVPGMRVWALNDDLKLEKRRVIDAWRTGERQMVKLTFSSGKSFVCSRGHRLYGGDGWLRADDVKLGSEVALPRALPGSLCEGNEGRWLLCGWLIGDGYLKGSAALTTTTAAEARYAAALGRKLFGLSPRVMPERRSANAMKVVFTTGSMTGAGKNDLTRWLRRIGAWGKVGAAKGVPESLWLRSDADAAAFLRGLFHADGSASNTGTSSYIRLSTISESLARGVQDLLARLGIRSAVYADRRNIGGYRTKSSALWTVYVGGRHHVGRFLATVGFLGSKHRHAVSRFSAQTIGGAGFYDRLPHSANRAVRRAKGSSSWADIGWREQGKRMDRSTAQRLGTLLDDRELRVLGQSDLIWERVVAAEDIGTQPAYDLTVEGLHNFVVDGVITHNSGEIEQDADAVMFLHRPGRWDESAPQDELEIHCEKWRFGALWQTTVYLKPGQNWLINGRGEVA